MSCFRLRHTAHVQPRFKTLLKSSKPTIEVLLGCFSGTRDSNSTAANRKRFRKVSLLNVQMPWVSTGARSHLCGKLLWTQHFLADLWL